MLKGALYRIISIDHTNNVINAVLEIKSSYEIFEGHFPGQPVLPGACMLHMVKEVLESSLTISVMLIKAENLKFLSLVNPNENNRLQLSLTYTIEDSIIKVNANLDSGETTCFKLQGSFVKV
jgi:3-hydroxyacyl-[acyl-carrier-protein] dehydratase